jgi:NtrC-family two-component system sensor histidine kinase KinB
MSLRSKLWCSFGGLLLILIAVSVLSVVVLTRYSRALENVFRENYQSAVYCNGMKESLDRLNARAEHLAWREDDAAALIDADAERKRFETDLARQLGNCSLPGETQLSERLAQLWKEYKAHYAEFDARPDSRQDLYRNDLLPRHQELKEVAQKVADMNMSNMISVDGQAKRTLLEVRNALLVLVVAGTVLAAALVAAVGATLQKPLGALTRSARQIGSGNLDLRVDIRSRDEIGQLIEAFNVMASRLREFRQLDHDRLARTQQTTQLAIDSLPDAVFVMSPDGLIEISNTSAARHFGIGPGAQVASLCLPWLTEIYDAVVKGGKPYEPSGYKSAIRLFSEGSERFLLPHAVPMQSPDGRTVGATVILVDVTRLRHEDELKSGRVSTVSHELRTPLTAIRMAVLLLLEENYGKLTPGQQRLLGAARDDGDRLYGIIEDLLNLSRIESGRARFQPRPIELSAFIPAALASLRRDFDAKNITVHEHWSGIAAMVLADPEGIGLALTNLLSNAAKFTPAGGTVCIEAEAEGEFIAISVADTGPGISAEHACRVFEKFFRIPRKAGQGGPTGAGLGLAIAREVVESHGGRIEFHPREGGGSVFRFTLPRVGPPDAGAPTEGRNEGLLVSG